MQSKKPAPILLSRMAEGQKPIEGLRNERFVSPIYGQLPGFADHVFKVSTAERIDVTAGRKKE